MEDSDPVRRKGCQGKKSDCLCRCHAPTCASAGAQCGSISNGCGQTLWCGSCPAGYACNANQCQCVPQWDCTGRCGMVDDTCGGRHSCGSCTLVPNCTNKRCGASNGRGRTSPGYCARVDYLC